MATSGESNYIIGGIVEDKGAEGRNVNQWHWTEKDITAWAKQHTTKLLADQVLVDEPALHIALTGMGLGGGRCAHQHKLTVVNTTHRHAHRHPLVWWGGDPQYTKEKTHPPV